MATNQKHDIVQMFFFLRRLVNNVASTNEYIRGQKKII